jgi:hypothetical protein
MLILLLSQFYPPVQALAQAPETLLEDRALVTSFKATSLARVRRFKAAAVVSRIEPVYLDVPRPSARSTAMPAHQGSGEPS